MKAPKHGHYETGLGFYSSVLGGWVEDPTKIGHITEAPPMTQSQRDEAAAWSTGHVFKADPMRERLITLRDSDRADDRAKFDKLVTGSGAISLGNYEAEKSSDAGGAQR